MDDKFWTILFSGGAAGIVLIIKEVVSSFITAKKEIHAQDLSSNEQAFTLYKKLVETLQTNVTQLTADMTKLEQEHLTCREEAVALKMNLNFLRDKLNIKEDAEVKPK